MVMTQEKKATVFDIQKFSIHDGPGIRTIVFLKGCPLRCQWCANPESNNMNPELLYFPDKCISCGRCIEKCKQEAIKKIDGVMLFSSYLCNNCLMCTEVCPSGARKMSGQSMTTEEVFEELMKDKVFYESSGGGITFSGGEPLLWPDFILELSKAVKEQGFSTAIETCGDYPEENFYAIKEFIDLLLFDIKIIDEKKHIKYCGVTNKRILSNLQIAFQNNMPVIVRIPIIPGVNDSSDDISSVIDFLNPYKHQVKAVNLLPYHNLGINKFDALGRQYQLHNLKAPSKEHMEEIKSLFDEEGFAAKIGG